MGSHAVELTHDGLRASLAARPPQRANDPMWKKYGKGSAWEWDQDTFRFIPPEKSPTLGFEVTAGDQPGQFNTMIHAIGALVGDRGLVRLDRYLLVDCDGNMVGNMLWRGNADHGELDAWFPTVTVNSFIRKHPAITGLQRTAMPSMPYIKEHYPALYEEVSRGTGGFLKRLFR